MVGVHTNSHSTEASVMQSSHQVKTKLALLSVAAWVCFHCPVFADITFNFTYTDVDNGSGFGFDDAAEGATRRATVDSVADYINTVVDHDGTVDINWNASTNEPAAGTLASMGSLYFFNSGISNGLVFQHATTGVDPSAGNPDGEGQVNFGRNWNSDLGGPAAGEFDLFSVVLHEISHAMGFASLFDPTDGSSQITGTRSVFDSLIEDGAGNRLLTGTTFTGNVSDFTSDDLFIDVGTGTLQLHAPSTFQQGSSLSHFDFGLPGSNVMVPGIAPAVSKREYSVNDLAVLSAIGWNLKAVPEPTSLSLVMIAGLCACGVRRRRS